MDDKDNEVYLGRDVILEVNPFVVPEGVEIVKVAQEDEGGLKKGLTPQGGG